MRIEYRYRCLYIILATLLIGLLLTSCQLPYPDTFTIELPYARSLDYQKVTFQEAESMVGESIPNPTYLPEGYEIQEVYIAENPGGFQWVIHMVISDEAIERKGDSITTKMMFSVWWMHTGAKMPWAKKIRVGDRFAMLVEETDHNAVTYIVSSRLTDLYASKRFSIRELSKILESVH